VKALLDTHVFLWMQSDPDRLSARTRAIVADADNTLLLSAASSWEIAIKCALGRLTLPDEPARYVPDRMRRSAVDGLAVAHAHALAVATLPPLHRDPFDRLLVAQARLEGLPIITADPAIRRYEVDIIDA
jgi:PIN domain nuclease of toxin-antitoxin system